jgi:hypothetical protein
MGLDAKVDYSQGSKLGWRRRGLDCVFSPWLGAAAGMSNSTGGGGGQRTAHGEAMDAAMPLQDYRSSRISLHVSSGGTHAPVTPDL